MYFISFFLSFSLGYTNNEQEHIFKKYNVTSFQMMRNVNFWQVIFLGVYLVFMHQINHHFEEASELQLAVDAFSNCPELRRDMGLFCLCAAIGQLTIFVVMKEFGSLMWITISITRKLFTILVSVIMFNHAICFEQWLGVTAVFSGE
jgi:solute carrier family 35 (UDP-galactose transporter), member B1